MSSLVRLSGFLGPVVGSEGGDGGGGLGLEGAGVGALDPVLGRFRSAATSLAVFIGSFLDGVVPSSLVDVGGKVRYGIRLPGLSGDTLEVTGVEKGLVAAEAGLMKGDLIIAMNGKPVATLSEDERMQCLRGSPLVLRVERGSDTLDITLSLE